tara:strand:+ start:38468 stop:39403 length:936 start_codon:yes stop_codon:yes gene_type:complete
MINCKICDKGFTSEKGLHCHLKQHGTNMAEYYTKYFPKLNKLTGEPLPFKNKKDYFRKDFDSRAQLIKWCKSHEKKEVGEYILKLLRERISDKKLVRGPSHVELRLAELPDVDTYVDHFGSYTQACQKAGVEPLFSKRLPCEFRDVDLDDIKIFIDTREQKPLTFRNSDVMKLDFGDYTAAGSDYDYTYIDRKSAGDFIGTLSVNNLDRFRRELERARDMDCYLFIITESSINEIYKKNRWGPHSTNLKFIYHNMRVLAHDFADTCQFVFSGSREASELIIPKILKLGEALWGVDLQYYIDKNELGNGKAT